ncbi:effector-associated constant component EACC1 [Streptosporangium sp. OZ121]|uniref:effector-associated constant component EACC1 n=1 Tax=Streptosporangium sp. OZ121 TaxID=3444183 RepID=UPI003F798ABC
MTVIVEMPGSDSDQLRNLRAWLVEEAGLRGNVHLAARPPAEHELGGSVDLLQLVLGSGGAAATAAGVVIAWLNTRKAEVTVRIRNGEREIEVTAKGVRALRVDELREVTARMAELLEPAEGD